MLGAVCINIDAVFYCVIARTEFGISWFSQAYPVNSNNLNYAGVAVGVVLIFTFGWCAPHMMVL